MSADDTISLTRTTDLAFGEPGQMVTVPRQVGSVRLERQIGQGAMGVVWLGTDELLRRRVAVKFLLTAVQGPDDPRLAAFLEGARAAAAVRHGNLTNILHAAAVENVPYLVMEYVDGPSLSAVLRGTGPLTPPELLTVMTDVCGAVNHLHDQQRVHRDIKPSNILLDEKGHAFVTDFGLSRELSARPGALREGGAPIAGTPAYMAPEMFEGQISGRSDVYALGVTAWELLTGKTPFGGTLEEVRRAHAESPPPAEALRERDVPGPLADTVERAIHKAAVFRHKSPAHFLAAIESACGGAGAVDRGRQLLWDRIIRHAAGGSNASPAAPASDAPSGPPPMTPGQTYYDRLRTIAEQKRREDDVQDAARPSTKSNPPPIAPVQSAFETIDTGAPVWPAVVGFGMVGMGALHAMAGPLVLFGALAAPSLGWFDWTTSRPESAGLWITFGIAASALSAALGVALLIAGIGVCTQKRRAVRSARIWAGVKIGFALACAVLVYAAARSGQTTIARTEPDTVLVLAIALLWDLALPAAIIAGFAAPSVRRAVEAWSK
ncbi:MAG: serine/threonine protein kinase [Phycisphaeraceae bacterium]|nr:serine/threonine protein kinase [Phycisphaeraceae bacterium]